MLHIMAILWKHKSSGLALSLFFCWICLVLRQIGFSEYGDIFWKDLTLQSAVSGWPEWWLHAAVPCKANIVIMGGGVPAPGQHCTASTLHKLSHYPGPWPILSQGTGAEAGCCTGGGGPSSGCPGSAVVPICSSVGTPRPPPSQGLIIYTWITRGLGYQHTRAAKEPLAKF